jgi:PAS domain S-box-containing protein
MPVARTIAPAPAATTTWLASGRDDAGGLPAAIACVCGEGRVRSWNLRAARLLGWSEEEAVGASFGTVLADREGTLARLLAAALDGTASDGVPATVVRRDGAELHVRVAAGPGEDGTAVFVLMDAPGDGAAADELAFQRQVLAGVGEAILAVDERLVITAWNDAAEELYGWSAAEALGRPVQDLLRTTWPSGDLAGVLRELFEHGTFSGEVRQRHRSGRELVVEVRARRLRDRIGRLSGFVLVNHDVTARRAAEAARAQAEEELCHVQKLEALGQLTAGIAHDFNNLLTAIQGYGELLAAQLDTPLREDAREVVRAAERGAMLTRQLLCLGRRGSQQSGARVDPSALVAGMESLLRRTLEERVELRLALARDVPAVAVDEGRLEQVVLNLVVNARDAMPAGGALTVSTDAVALDGVPYARIQVVDTGVGMGREVASRALEPFFTTKGPGAGTGLGLATVARIVREAGGAVELESAEGRGTTVTVLLPAAGGPAAPAARIV